jgi:hypothetical protein
VTPDRPNMLTKNHLVELAQALLLYIDDEGVAWIDCAVGALRLRSAEARPVVVWHAVIVSGCVPTNACMLIDALAGFAAEELQPRRRLSRNAA